MFTREVIWKKILRNTALMQERTNNLQRSERCRAIYVYEVLEEAERERGKEDSRAARAMTTESGIFGTQASKVT